MRPLHWWVQRSPGPLLPEHKYPQRLCAPERGTFRFDPTEHERARPVPITYYLPKGYDAKRAAPPLASRKKSDMPHGEHVAFWDELQIA